MPGVSVFAAYAAGWSLQPIEEGLRAEVERVVVRKGDAVDAEVVEDGNGFRWSAEEERLLGVRPRLATLGDAALEIEHEQVGLPGQAAHARADERLRASRPDRLRHLAAEHRVAGERKPEAGHSVVDTRRCRFDAGLGWLRRGRGSMRAGVGAGRTPPRTSAPLTTPRSEPQLTGSASWRGWGYGWGRRVEPRRCRRGSAPPGLLPAERLIVRGGGRPSLCSASRLSRGSPPLRCAGAASRMGARRGSAFSARSGQ